MGRTVPKELMGHRGQGGGGMERKDCAQGTYGSQGAGWGWHRLERLGRGGKEKEGSNEATC